MAYVRNKTIVLLGMVSTMPVAGNMWLVAQYIVGFKRLGYDVYYVEAHGMKPASELQRAGDEHRIRGTCDFLSNMLHRFDMGNRWAYHALCGDGHCYGISGLELERIYRSADLIINLHGATTPLPEHTATGRLVYLETDPVQAELSIYNGDRRTMEIVTAHNLFFTWGLNYSNQDCRVPMPPGITFHPTFPPVVIDFWDSPQAEPRDVFTTVGNWRQRYKRIEYNGEIYHWSKHHEFLKFVDLPSHTPQQLELALSSSSHNASEKKMLERHGWQIRDALEISADMNKYRDYVTTSRGEFTVAKDQNIRLRSGWFSERSAQYLAAGRPVITQETGFSNVLPVGDGLFGFNTTEQALAAVEQINCRYEHHCRAATAIAVEYFSYRTVLPRLLSQAGISTVGSNT